MTTASGVRVSKLCPSYLHANSTSHTWVFSALAELIDNAHDAEASTLYIDCEEINTTTTLTFRDDGSGLDPQRLYNMLSFGFCEKDMAGAVGMYGNGFKSGSMRLGRDAMVLSVQEKTMCVGLLSQTYLRQAKKETIVVPLVTFNRQTGELQGGGEAVQALQDVIIYSLFKSTEQLKNQFTCFNNQKSGTKIIIYNLNRDSSGRLELDIESNREDIINSESVEVDSATTYRPVKDYQPEMRRSLRAYCSVLFLKPHMKIVLRGKKVATKLISKSLSKTEKDVYRPKWLERPVQIIFGFCAGQQDGGIMMYHNNRLIKGYERVGCQKQCPQSLSVVGVVEVNFLTPVHNKQDFNKTDRYNACMNALGHKLTQYWNEKQGGTGAAEKKLPDWTWAQCDNCLKWRRLPDGFSEENLPDKWFCYMNPDPSHNRCQEPEEPEDEDELFRSTYTKTQQRKQEQEKQRRRASLDRRENNLLEKERRLDESLAQTRQEKLVSDAQLNQAKKQLEEAKQKEEQQLRVIHDLLVYKPPPEIAARMRRRTPNNHAPSTASKPPAQSRKRDVVSSTVTETEVKEENPPPAKQARRADVVILDSDDETDVKPDLDKIAVNRTEVKCEADSASDTVVKTEDSELARVQAELTETRTQLDSLRSNVRALLRSIVPDVDVNSLTNVDNFILEMLRLTAEKNEESS